MTYPEASTVSGEAHISVARKLARRCYHVLRSVEPERVYALPA